MSGGEPGTRTLNLAVKSRLLCQIELAPLMLLLSPAGAGSYDWRIWGGRWDSNPRRPGSQPGALPAELRPPLFLKSLSN